RRERRLGCVGIPIRPRLQKVNAAGGGLINALSRFLREADFAAFGVVQTRFSLIFCVVQISFSSDWASILFIFSIFKNRSLRLGGGL
ncbi:MAG: hypothetical protein IKX88_13115, partial [Thermoguttaceae bacterium]|nr:hypothetical protein [Thermoguttaceae bacterium]